jgi:hypothetical protein
MSSYSLELQSKNSSWSWSIEFSGYAMPMQVPILKQEPWLARASVVQRSPAMRAAQASTCFNCASNTCRVVSILEWNSCGHSCFEYWGTLLLLLWGPSGWWLSMIFHPMLHSLFHLRHMVFAEATVFSSLLLIAAVVSSWTGWNPSERREHMSWLVFISSLATVLTWLTSRRLSFPVGQLPSVRDWLGYLLWLFAALSSRPWLSVMYFKVQRFIIEYVWRSNLIIQLSYLWHRLSLDKWLQMGLDW